MWIFILFLVLLAAAAVLTDLYFYCCCRFPGLLFIHRRGARGHESWYYTRRDAFIESSRQQAWEELLIPSVRGGTVKGYLLPASGTPSKKLVFLVHGFRSHHHEAAGPFLDYYRSRGFDVFAPDHRSHGENPGQIIGYDVWESEDCLHWLDTLIARYGKDVEILLHGFSMGAATVLKMSDRLPPQVKCLAEDSGYTGIDEIFRENLGILSRPIAAIHVLCTGRSFEETRVYDNIARAKIPALFVHGRDDRLVPFRMGQALYEAYPAKKDCFFTDTTRHIETGYLLPEEYARRLDLLWEQRNSR